MKNASIVEYKPTAFASLPGWMLGPKLSGFKSGAMNYWPCCVIVCVGFGWLAKSICQNDHLVILCYNVMHLQHGNCPIVAFWPTTNNKQRTNQIHAGCYKVVDLNPTAAI